MAEKMFPQKSDMEEEGEKKVMDKKEKIKVKI